MTIYPAPKPAPREKAPKPKKPRTPLKSSARLSRSGPVKKVNRERLDRRTKAYRAYMASPEWKARRLAALVAAEHQCQRCGYSPFLFGVPEPVPALLVSAGLHVHHRTYARFGHERVEDLEVLCESCHMHHHAHQLTKPRGLRGGRN